MLTTENPFKESDALLRDETSAQADLNVARKHIKELFSRAFVDGDGALNQLKKLSWEPYSPERIVAILHSDVRRWINFGFVKRSLSDATVHLEARKALATLPEALRHEHRCATSLRIIFNAREDAQIRELQQVRKMEHSREHTTTRDRPHRNHGRHR